MIIAYIESPLQCMNLIECVYSKNMNLDLVIINYRQQTSSKNKTQIQRLLPFLPEHERLEVDAEGNLAHLGEWKRSVKLAVNEIQKRQNGREHILIGGEYRSLIFWAIEGKCSNVVERLFIDDGSSTMRIQRRSLKSNILALGESALYNVLGESIYKAKASTFFSIYPIQNQLRVGDKYEKNSYAYLRGLIAQKSPSSTLFVIGTPLKEAGVSKVDDIALTLSMIQQIKHRNPKLTPVYIPHRRERSEKIDAIKQHIDVRSLDYPFEFYSIFESERVAVMAGLYSSLFDNMYHMMGNNIRVETYDIRHLPIEPNYSALIRNSYANYEQYGYSIYSLA